MANNIYRVPTIYSDIKKTTEPLSVRVPGSKSITNRSLLLAMLAEGKSTLRGVLFSDDSRHFLKCVQDLGFETTVDEESYIVTVEGLGGKLPCEEATLNVGSAGTAARFLTATLGVSEGVFHMDSSEQMKRRPMDPLLSSLAELGCEVRCEGEDGHFPFTLTAHGFGQDHISIDIGHSSQFLSALLIASTLSSEDFMIQVEGTHGMAYIEMTRKMMEQFGVRVEHPAADQFRICTGQKYRALDYQIEPDVSAACYFSEEMLNTSLPFTVSYTEGTRARSKDVSVKVLAAKTSSVTLTRSASTKQASPGEEITLTYRISNTGDAPITVTSLVDREIGGKDSMLKEKQTIEAGSSSEVQYVYKMGKSTVTSEPKVTYKDTVTKEEGTASAAAITLGMVNSRISVEVIQSEATAAGVTFTLNGGEALPGVVQVEMTGDNAAYTRVYLHNAVKGKWQFLNSYKDNVLEADTAGEYLLTTQNLRFAHVDMTFFIAGLVVIVGIIIAYIVIKKRYWFW